MEPFDIETKIATSGFIVPGMVMSVIVSLLTVVVDAPFFFS
jgi:hypothetical protein